ncbi:MFS transporter [Bacteriovoracaceae bacterium]|nr:MFS transporter [Bacteriovoracaceae bacterium]
MLLSDRKFWPLFWTQFLGALTDNIFKNSLVMLITYKSIVVLGMGAGLLVPAIGGIFILPFFLFSATAGQIADHYEKSKVIKVTKFTEFIIIAIASYGFYSDSYGLLILVLFLMGTQSAFFGPLKYGVIPSLVAKEKIVEATAFVSAGTFLAILLGTIIGGVVVDFDQYAFALTLVLLGFSGIGIIYSQFMGKVSEPNSGVKVDYTFIKPTWNIIKLTMKNKEVFTTVLGISWFWFIGAAILSLLPNLVKTVMNGSSIVATLFLATFTIGMGFGSFVTEKISNKKVEIGMVPIAALFMSLFFFDLYYISSNWVAAPYGTELFGVAEFFSWPGSIRAIFSLFMICSFGGGYIVPQMSYIQEIANRKELARTIAGNNIWNALFMVTSAIVVMVLKNFGIPNTLLIVGILNLVTAFLLYAYHSENTLRMWMKFFSKVFYDVEVKGVENLPENGSYLIASNHVSFIDWVFLMGAVKRPINFVIDWAYYYLPTGPFWFKQAGLVPIATRRESEEVLKQAFEQMYERIDRGVILGVFPEGWITRDGEMRKFQPGVQKIIKNKPVPIYLCAIDGLWGSIYSFYGGRVILKIPKLIPFKRKVTLTFSEAIEPEDYDPKKAQLWIQDHVTHYTGETIINGQGTGVS